SRPCASSNVSSIGSTRPIPARTVARWSSTLRRVSTFTGGLSSAAVWPDVRSSSAMAVFERCDVLLQPGPEFVTERRMLGGELHDRTQVVQPVAGVEAAAPEDDAVHRHAVA